MAIERKPVASASGNMKSMGYADGILEIEFGNGNVYQYTGENVAKFHEELLKAKSPGGYFSANIRGCKKTVCKKIHDAKEAAKK